MRKFYLIIAAFVVLVLVITGCRGNTGSKQQTTPRQPTTTKPVGPPTYVAKGKTPEQHVQDYYNAYKEQRFDDAFDLQPAENKAKQAKEEFVNLRKGLPIDEFKVLPVETQDQNRMMISVEYNVGQYGVWVSKWEFEKKGGKWEALRYLASMKEQ